jgi:phage-related protein
MNVLKTAKHLLAILCIAVIFCSGCKKDKQRVYPLLPPEPEDVTSQASVSVNLENPGGADATEGSSKVIDNDKTTKFLIFDYDPSLYIQLQFREAQDVTSYSLTSANDSPERDPKSWKLSGSNDGKVWVDVDTRTNETFSDREVTNNYVIDNKTAYKYYRLTITENNGDSLFQMAEWRVISTPILDK